MTSAVVLLLWAHLTPGAPPSTPPPKKAALAPVIQRQDVAVRPQAAVREKGSDRQEPAGRQEQEAADTLVVCAPALRQALQPWLEHRRSQGHRLLLTTSVSSPEAIQRAVRAAADRGALKHIVLVGDVQNAPAEGADGNVSQPAASPAGAQVGVAHVPTMLVPAKIIQRWGSEANIASDQGYADLDGNGRPEYAIGRLAVDSPEELQALVRKIIAYERQESVGTWRQRINLIAGVGGFGVLADAVLETAVRSSLTRGIPPEYRTSMTYASWRSPYCPDPRAFRRTTMERMNEGCFCWVYIGHGHPLALDQIRVPTGVAPILTVNDAPRIACPEGHPIAVFLSCYAGAFDGRQDCLAERLVMNEQGPVAAIAGSRVTMPYGMTVLSDALMHQMFRERQATLGEVILAAKCQVWDGAEKGPSEHPWMDAIARALSPKPHDLAGERREHLWLFNLLGDPLLRMAHPQPIELQVPSMISPGETLTVRGQGQVAGECLVELTCRRGRMTFRPEPRTQFDGTHEGMAALDEIYRKANEDRYATCVLTTTEPNFTAELRVPEDVEGSCVVRAFIRGEHAFAMGATSLQVKGAGDRMTDGIRTEVAPTSELPETAATESSEEDPAREARRP